MKDLLIDLMTAGEAMRDKQRRYFKTRAKSDLYAAFTAEKAFDVAVAKCKRALEPDLFTPKP